MPADMTYEIGMVIAEGDLVAIHGRYTGWGPAPLIDVDIYRVEDGKIAEHWDMAQDAVLETASGNHVRTDALTPTRPARIAVSSPGA